MFLSRSYRDSGVQWFGFDGVQSLGALGFLGIGSNEIRHHVGEAREPVCQHSQVSGFRVQPCLPGGSKVVPFWGSYLESYKVIPKRNYYGAYG